MAQHIKGITVEIGGDVSGLTKALKTLNKDINSTQSELQRVERLLKMDPQNVVLLEQKQELLAKAIQQTTTKVEALKAAKAKADKEMAAGTQINERQYRELERQIISSELSLQGLKDKAAQTENVINKVDEKPIKEVERAADQASDALDDAQKSASNFGDYLKAGTIIEGVKGIASAISDVAEQSQEYSKVMGTLETSSEAAGYTADQTNEAFYQLFWVLGDTQAAATATANLQALKLEQGELNKMLELTVGAWATYGDSIPIDGLAESINETIRVGQVTGTFADVLNWGSREGETFGVMLKENTEANKAWNDAVMEAESAEDFFNLALQDASTQGERANIVMQAMASQGLADTAHAWYQNNKDIVNANDAQLEFMDSAGELAKRIEPVKTAIQEGGNQILDTFLGLSDEIDFNALADKIDQVFTTVSNVITFLVQNKDAVLSVLSGIAAGLVALNIAKFIGDLKSGIGVVTAISSAFPLLGGVISALTNPVFLVSAAVVALVALIVTKGQEIIGILQSVDDFLQGVFTVDWTNIFGPVLGNILNAFFTNISNIWNGIKQIFEGVINFIQGVFTGNWQQAWEGVKQIFSGVWDTFVGIVKAPVNAIIGLINGLIGAINMAIGGLNSLKISVPDWIPGIGGKSFGFNIPSIPTIPYLAKGGTVLSGSAIVGEAGPELLTVGPGGTRVQPLTNSGGTAKGGAAVTIENVTFYGYTPQQGRALVRDLNRQLGRLYV